MAKRSDEGMALTGEADAVVGVGLAGSRSIVSLRKDSPPLSVVGDPVGRIKARGAAWDRSGCRMGGEAMLGRQIAV
jgi:hypothetical protein